MIHVGLTGNVASGKSAVARVWAEAGVPVVDADRLARDAVAPGSEGLARVVERFGAEVLTEEGELDRRRLRALVFRDHRARRGLEAILHPIIARLREEWTAARAAEGHALVVSEIPLLYEAGLAGVVDRVVVVHAPVELRRRRLVEERGIDSAEAERILDSQGDPDEKRRRADHVIVNDGTLDALEERARELLAVLRGDAGVAREGGDP